jgi:hypothetical protein
MVLWKSNINHLLTDSWWKSMAAAARQVAPIPILCTNAAYDDSTFFGWFTPWHGDTQQCMKLIHEYHRLPCGGQQP